MALPRACSRHSKSGAALMEAGKNPLVDPIIEYPFAMSRACIQQTKSVAPGQMAKTQAMSRNCHCPSGRDRPFPSYSPHRQREPDKRVEGRGASPLKAGSGPSQTSGPLLMGPPVQSADFADIGDGRRAAKIPGDAPYFF
jgi:hypothetical protein